MHTQIYTYAHTQALRAAERELETAYVQAVVNCAGIPASCAAPAIQVPPPHLESSLKQPQNGGREHAAKHVDDSGGKENTGGKEMLSPGLQRLLGALTPERLPRKVCCTLIPLYVRQICIYFSLVRVCVYIYIHTYIYIQVVDWFAAPAGRFDP